MRTTSDGNVAESPLTGLRYPVAATALWRWLDAPEDDVIRAFLTRCADADRLERARLRSLLSVEDFFSLVTFAQRSVLAALRTEGADHVRQAWSSLAMIDVHRCADPKDVWMSARLVRYATERLDLDPADATRVAFDMADPETLELLTEVLADDEADLTEDCGLREARSATGPIIVEDDDETYIPDTDLLAIALRVPALLAEHGYPNASVTIAATIGGWLEHLPPPVVRVATDEINGTVSVHADPAGGRATSLLVFIAELRSADAAELVAAAITRKPDARYPVLGRARGRLCAIVIAFPAQGADFPIPASGRAMLIDRIADLLPTGIE